MRGQRAQAQAQARAQGFQGRVGGDEENEGQDGAEREPVDRASRVVRESPRGAQSQSRAARHGAHVVLLDVRISFARAFGHRSGRDEARAR